MWLQLYEAVFHGQVIDMFYVDIWEGRVADWIPIFGGDYLSLWPIFNIADASIFVGVAIILIFQKRFFNEKSFENELLSEYAKRMSDTITYKKCVLFTFTDFI